MGFGLLLVGYFTAAMMSLNSFGAVFAVVGYTVTCVAAKKLSEYNNSFYTLFAASVLSIFSSLALAVSVISEFLYENLLIGKLIVTQEVLNIVSNIKGFSDFLFVFALCYSVRKIAVETGAAKVPYLAVRNFIFYTLGFGMQMFIWISAKGNSEPLKDFITKSGFVAWAVIIMIISIILICLMLFSCYRQICDQNDVDMPRKPSRFEFVNKRRAKKEELRNKYSSEAEEYRRNHPTQRKNQGEK